MALIWEQQWWVLSVCRDGGERMYAAMVASRSMQPWWQADLCSDGGKQIYTASDDGKQIYTASDDGKQIYTASDDGKQIYAAMVENKCMYLANLTNIFPPWYMMFENWIETYLYVNNSLLLVCRSIHISSPDRSYTICIISYINRFINDRYFM